MKKMYSAYLYNKTTHLCIAIITISADGYLTALAEAHRLCTLNHPNLYVAQVVANQ